MILPLILALSCWPLLTEGCGQSAYSGTSRVVNGDNARQHAWPWQISLRVNGGHICGGSLISNQWVVTAAHCTAKQPYPNAYTVVVGAHWRTGRRTEAQRVHRVSHLYQHRGFSFNHFRNDLTLLRLAKPVQINRAVRPVCLPQGGSRIAAGTTCYITGWGRMRGGGYAANVLQQARLPVAYDNYCANKNGQMMRVDTNSMICAGGQGGAGGCQGDSGGPFVCNEGGRWVLRGAVSWGHKMCRTDFYTVFARISWHRNWIRQRTGI